MFVQVSPGGHTLPSSILPSQSSSLQLHVSVPTGTPPAHCTAPLTHSYLPPHVDAELHGSPQITLVPLASTHGVPSTMPSSTLPSQSSSKPLQISALPLPVVHWMTPLMHWVTPPHPPHAAGWKSSSILPSQSLSMPSHGSLGAGLTSP